MPIQTVPFRPIFEDGIYHEPTGRGNPASSPIVGWSLGDVYSHYHDGKPAAGSVFDAGLRTEERWEAAAPFHGILELHNLQHNKRVTVVDRANNRWYSFSSGDFFDTIKRVDVRNGVLDGLFKFNRKGGIYGIETA